MIRREFIALLGIATTTWPLAARAHRPAMPVIGLLGSNSAQESIPIMGALRAGLKESGLIEGQDLTIEYRWADRQYDRLPILATDLVKRKVAIVVTMGAEPAALAAKAATNTIPIVFVVNGDPVTIGLVESLNRPGRNCTGFSLIAPELEAKRLELLRELVPKTSMIAVLANSEYADTDTQLASLQTAAVASGQKIQVAYASTEAEVDTAFTTIAQQQVSALLVAADPFFNQVRDRIIALAAHYRLPAIYDLREFVVAGGMMSYGASMLGAYHRVGIYVDKILNGAKPADLPVQQPTSFELVINLKTAKTLALDVPADLVALADEVIE